VDKGSVDHALGRGRAGAQSFKVVKRTAEHIGAGSANGCGRRI
jgi:hypothetical protein